ncbi:trihelix transcription factor GTL2-like isoform X2 [Harpegnathos saltator]|nr:trihelix transcription factor GTL2-like isoform X2 [Harpegnathos saltator]
MIGDLPVFNSKGLLVQDVQSDNIIVVPICEETAKFFNLQLTEESPIHDNGGPNSADMVELGETTVPSTASWKNDNEVRCLINLWQDHQNHFKDMKSRDVWLMISKELKNSNREWNQKSPVQCENKWKDIKRKYMETKDHNNKSGNDPKTCKLYEELEEVLGEQPCVKPITVASNLIKRKRADIKAKDPTYFEEMSEDYESPTEGEEGPLSKKRQRKITKVQRELQDWSTALLSEAKSREEARKRCHRENMAESKAAMDAYKEMMGKLIDKLCFFVFPR